MTTAHDVACSVLVNEILDASGTVYTGDIEVMADAVLAALGIPADATTDDIKAANLAGIAGRSPVDVRAGLILLDRLRNSSYRQDVDKATFAIQQAQRDYAAAVAEVEEAAR